MFQRAIGSVNFYKSLISFLFNPTENTRVAQLTTGQSYVIPSDGIYRFVGESDTVSAGGAQVQFNGLTVLYQYAGKGRLQAVIPVKKGVVIKNNDAADIMIYFLQAL